MQVNSTVSVEDEERIKEIEHGSFSSIVFTGALGKTSFTRVAKSECLSVVSEGNHCLDEDQTHSLMDWLNRQFNEEF